MSPNQELAGEFLGDRVSLDQARQTALHTKAGEAM